MSLVSASRLVGGLKEYVYRGFQQLPLVVGSTSMLFTIATGSIAHANIVLGMGVLMPIYTYVMQWLIGTIMTYYFPSSIFWKRITSDSCNIIPEFNDKTGGLELSQFKGPQVDASLPSYWLMGMAFFIGYSISNAVDSLLTPEWPGADEMNREKRNHQATIVIITCVIFGILIIGARFYFMPGCEGIQSGWAGVLLTLLSAAGAAGIGYRMYTFSKECGARSSDLFGILSQILPPSAIGPRPVVCTADDS